jgi:hypothetical protein
MKNKPEVKFRDIVYKILIDYAAETLNSEELAPKFKSRTKDDRILIKKKILEKLRKKADEISEAIEKRSTDTEVVLKQKEEVEKIVVEILKDSNEN